MVKNFKAAAQGMIARAGAALRQSIFPHIGGEIFSLVMSMCMRSEFHKKFVGGQLPKLVLFDSLVLEEAIP
jgi:hypothetical protein